jgi:hypothetical protein
MSREIKELEINYISLHDEPRWQQIGKITVFVDRL